MLQVTTTAQAIFAGAFGGAAVELVHLIRLAKAGQPLKSSPVYWLATVGVVVLGMFVPLLYIDLPTSAIMVFQLGASAPLIVETATANPPKSPAEFKAQSARGSKPSIWAQIRMWASW